MRQVRAKLKTEAYYLGKSLAHLITIALASLFFTVCFHALVPPVGVSFWRLYAFYGSIYLTCAGLAYLVSFVVKPTLAQLAGVLVILVFMMFSGANPTLSQLKHNKLLPGGIVSARVYGSDVHRHMHMRAHSHAHIRTSLLYHMCADVVLHLLLTCLYFRCWCLHTHRCSAGRTSSTI